MAKKQNKYTSMGVKGVTKNPISKSIGGGEPLVIHVHMKGKKEKGETNPDEEDMKHEKEESEDECEMEGDPGCEKKEKK